MRKEPRPLLFASKLRATDTKEPRPFDVPFSWVTDHFDHGQLLRAQNFRTTQAQSSKHHVCSTLESCLMESHVGTIVWQTKISRSSHKEVWSPPSCSFCMNKQWLKTPCLTLQYQKISKTRNYFTSNDPTVTKFFVIVSDISSGSIYGTYFLTFYSGILSDILFWRSIWHSFWYSIWHVFWHSILARKPPDICHILWHSFWHMYLAYPLTFFLAFYLV